MRGHRDPGSIRLPGSPSPDLVRPLSRHTRVGAMASPRCWSARHLRGPSGAAARLEPPPGDSGGEAPEVAVLHAEHTPGPLRVLRSGPRGRLLRPVPRAAPQQLAPGPRRSALRLSLIHI
eukprot:2837963-Alexandrium_andersonii.AAC.1